MIKDEDNHIFKENLLQIDKDEEADVNDNDNSKLIEKFMEDLHFFGNAIYCLSKYKPEFVNYYFPDMKIRIEYVKEGVK